MRAAWNRPVLWPLGIIVAVLVIFSLPALVSYRRRERMAARPV
jgi:oligopeptide transport system substrate-binding protein